jgi:hypothetical protein
MPVLINEFEAVAEPAAEGQSAAAGHKSPRRLKPNDIVSSLRVLALRAARVRAH